MRIAIMGAGAMGSLFGALLHKADAEVWLVDGWQEHMDKVRADGLLVTGDDGEETIALNATTDAHEPGVVDLVVLFTKTHGLEQATREALPMIDENTMVLGLQNGLGHAETISSIVPAQQVLHGFTYLGADLLGPGHIRSAMMSPILKFKPVNGVVSESHRNLLDVFEQIGIQAEIPDDIETEIWTKLTRNACFNPVCALTRIHGQGVATHPAAPRLIEAMVSEIIAVARARGVELDGRTLTENMMKAIAEYPHLPSMAQDVKNKRITEIQALNGAVVREGEKAGIPTPVHATITSLISIVETTYGEQF